ncbi:HEAT repeat domain-containing protein [Candidatus Omnitrophota bacterium]
MEPLILALKDKDASVRVHAEWALLEIKDPRAVEYFIPILKDDHYFVRQTAARALADIKDPRAVEPLIEALRDEASVRNNARQALIEITGQNFGNKPMQWHEWLEQDRMPETR